MTTVFNLQVEIEEVRAELRWSRIYHPEDFEAIRVDLNKKLNILTKKLSLLEAVSRGTK